MRAALAQLASSPSVRRALASASELAPLWWAARAYIAVGLFALLAGVQWSAQHPALPRFGSGIGTAFVLALGLAGSIALGLRARRPGRSLRRPIIALNAVLLLAALPVLDKASDAPRIDQAYFEPVATGTLPGVVLDGVPVENIYPYDRRGRLLHDVRLYDNRGRPMAILQDDPDRRQVFERGGERVLNAFPIRHFEPGTRRVARPNAGPDVDPRPLRTPALERRRRR